MKTCLICAAESPDNAPTCAACGEGSFGAPAQKPATVPVPVHVLSEPSGNDKARHHSPRRH